MTDPVHVLILGAHSDIGTAIARVYAAQGARLQLAARHCARLETLAADLRIRHQVPVTLHACDVLDGAAHPGFLASLEPLPDTVICVVGLMTDQARCSEDPELADLVMRTNFNGPARLLGLFATAFAERGHGTLIGISSVAGDRGRAVNYTYGAAKAGFTAVLSGLRQRLAGRGVHVITVKPGMVTTRMTEGMKLPKLVTVGPEVIAQGVWQADRHRRSVVYLPWYWQPIMGIIGAIPEPVFRKLKF